MRVQAEDRQAVESARRGLTIQAQVEEAQARIAWLAGLDQPGSGARRRAFEDARAKRQSRAMNGSRGAAARYRAEVADGPRGPGMGLWAPERELAALYGRQESSILYRRGLLPFIGPHAQRGLDGISRNANIPVAVIRCAWSSYREERRDA